MPADYNDPYNELVKVVRQGRPRLARKRGPLCPEHQVPLVALEGGQAPACPLCLQRDRRGEQK